MKNTFIFLLLALVAAGLSACKDKEVIPDSNMIYDGKEYELSNGLLIDYGIFSSNEGSGQELFLSSSGVKIREKGGKIDSIYGAGHAILFQLFSGKEGELTPGEYHFNYTPGPFKSGAFIYSYAVFDADFVKLSSRRYEMIKGDVTVGRSGENYIISFDCVETSGKHVTGYFRGPLNIYDER
jgi:hypothetical protein